MNKCRRKKHFKNHLENKRMCKTVCRPCVIDKNHEAAILNFNTKRNFFRTFSLWIKNKNKLSFLEILICFRSDGVRILQAHAKEMSFRALIGSIIRTRLTR